MMPVKDLTELFYLTAVSHLLHLIAVAFAINLAYITLEPYRYTRRVRDLYESVRKEIKAIEQRLNHNIKDTALLELELEIKSLKTIGLGPCFGCKKIKIRGLFGTKAQSGWDVIVVSFFIGILFILLALAAVEPKLFYYTINVAIVTFQGYFAAIIIALIGSCLPASLIFFGNRIIRAKEKKIIKMLDTLRNAHGINIDIDAYQRSIHDF